jgi:translation initiation factor 1A
MPKNTQGGKKYKKQKHKNNEPGTQRALVKPTEGQVYAIVTKLLGNSRVSGSFYDTRDPGNSRINEIICFLRPGLKKKRQFARMGSIILISLRDFEKDKADVIYVYDDEEANRMRRKDLLPEHLKKKESNGEDMIFADDDSNSDVEEVIEEKPKSRGNNISIQDLGLPPINFDDEDDIENI